MVYFLDLVVSIASLTMMAIGITMATLTLKKYRESRKVILLLSSILFITLPLPWLAGVIDLVFIELRDGAGLSILTIVIMSAFPVPIFSTTWIYITGSLYERKSPKIKYVVGGISVIIALIFYYFVFILEEYESNPIDNSNFKNVDYSLIPNLLIVIYAIFAVAFIFPSYLYFAFTSKNELFKFRSRAIAFSIFTFAISGITDLLLVFDNVASILVVRSFTLASLISLYLGYNTPQRIREKYE